MRRQVATCWNIFRSSTSSEGCPGGRRSMSSVHLINDHTSAQSATVLHETPINAVSNVTGLRIYLLVPTG